MHQFIKFKNCIVISLFILLINYHLTANASFHQDFIPTYKDTLQYDSITVNLHLKKASEKGIDMEIKLLHINSALNISEEINYNKGIASSLLLKSELEFQSGLFEKATHSLLNAMDIYKEDNDYKNEVKSLRIICNYHIHMSDFTSALNYFKKYYSVSKKYDIKNAQVEALAGIGFSYLRMNFSDSAITYLNKSSDFAEKNNIIYPTERNNVIISNAYYDLKNYQKAKNYIKRINIEESSISVNPTAIYYYLFSLIEYKLGNTLAADSLYSFAESIEPDKKDILTLDDLYQIKYKADSTFNRFFNALKGYQDLINIKEDIDKYDFMGKLANFRVLTEMDNKQNEIINLQKENELILLKKGQTRIYILAGILGSIILFIFLIFTLRSLKFKTKANKQLYLLNEKLKQQKYQLKFKNEEISEQREELYKKSKTLNDSLNELKYTQTKIIHTEKMASIGIMTNGIAHEINNPLNFISGGALILEDIKTEESIKVDPVLNSVINEIIEGVEESSDKLKSLLINTYDGTVKMVKSEVNKLIEYSLKLITTRIPKDLIIKKEYSEIPEVFCYRDKIIQVFINILNNAFDSVKEIKNKFELIIGTELIEETNSVRISIYNTGDKIEENTIKHIFDPFFSTKENTKSTGLGLTTCNNIIQEHEGEIHLFNDDDGVVCEIIMKTDKNIYQKYVD